LDYLNRNGVRYSHSTHAPAFTATGVAEAEHMPVHDLAKTVVYFGDRGFGMAVVPADRFVNLLEIARLMGLSDIRLAHEAELRKLFPGDELGAMPPFGNFYDMPVLVDRTIADAGFIAFTIGAHSDLVRMNFSDFESFVRPLVGQIAGDRYQYSAGQRVVA
jgi:Ala-tRNA(Pro) deacylase